MDKTFNGWLETIFGPVLTAFEVAIKLWHTYIGSRQKTFTEIVEPLYQALKQVREKYVKLLNDTRRALINAKGRPSSKLLQNLRDEIEDFRGARIEVREQAKRLAIECDDTDLIEFCNSVATFFEIGDTGYPKQPSSKRLVDLMGLVGSGRVGKEDLIEYIKEAVDKMDKNWGDVNSAYAKARIDYLQTSVRVKRTPTASKKSS